MNNKKNTSPIINYLSKSIAHHPWRSIFLGLLLFSLLAPGLRFLQSDFSYRIWYRDEDPLLKKYDLFERQFGNDETIAIIVHNKNGIFNQESLKLVQNLTKDLWTVPEIIRVDSLTNYNWTHSKNDEILIEPLIPDDLPLTTALIEERKDAALEHEMIPGYLVSHDGKTTVLYTLIKPSFEGSPDYHLIIAGKKTDEIHIEGIRDKIKKYKSDGYSFHITGPGAISNNFQEASIKDLSFLVPLLLVMITLITLILIKSFLGLSVALMVIISTILMTLGFAGYFGITMNTVVSTLPNILTAICIADAIHIIVTWQQLKTPALNPVDHIIKTLEKNIKPTFLTTLSTSIGFFSFSSAKVLPISYQGYLAGTGVFIAWFMTLLIIPPILLLFSSKQKKTQKTTLVAPHNPPKEWAIKITHFLSKYPKSIILIFLALTLGAAIVGLQNEVNSDPFKYFPEKSDLRIANDFLEEHVGGASGIEIVVKSGKADGIKDPVFLKKVETFQDWLNQYPQVTKTISIIDILKQTNRSLNGDLQSYYRLPDSQEAVAQELFLYTMGLPQGMDLNNRMTLNYDSLRITLLWTLHKSKQALETYEIFRNKAEEIGLDIVITGKTGLYQSMNGNVVQSFLSSISIAIIIIALLMMVTFKSWSLGLLTMIPNLIPLILGAGLMTLLKKPLDIGTVLVSSVCLGIAVDDSIHFLNHYFHCRKEGMNKRAAMAHVFSFTGPALLTTSIILVCGFGTFAFASFVPNINFGILTALILSTALLADFILLPALLFLDKGEESLELAPSIQIALPEGANS